MFNTRVGSLNTLVNQGAGSPSLYVLIIVATTATSGGSATAAFRLVSDSVSLPDTSTATVHFTTAPIPVASLTAGYRVCCFALPYGEYERYLGIQQVTGTAPFTAGAIDAFLTSDPSAWRAYASAFR